MLDPSKAGATPIITPSVRDEFIRRISSRFLDPQLFLDFVYLRIIYEQKSPYFHIYWRFIIQRFSHEYTKSRNNCGLESKRKFT